MRRTPKRTTFMGLRSRAYRCRLERLESRSMMASDVVEAAIDPVSGEAVATESMVAIAVDEWQAWDPVVCDLQPCDFVDPAPAVDPVIVDDSSLMVFEPADIRVQFVSSETDPGWAAYSYTVGADGVVQDVSVVASYDEPTIAAFVAEHAEDPAVQISDFGDGWWISGFPLELAPPVPEYGPFDRGDGTSSNESWDAGTVKATEYLDVGSDWSWDGSTDAGVEWTWDAPDEAFTDWSGSWYVGSWDDSGDVYAVERSGPICFCCGLGDEWSGGWYDAVEYGGDGAVLPLFNARGVDLSDPFAQETFGTYSLANDTEVAAVPVEQHDVPVPVPATVNPRSAAFADMSMMAAMAAAAQGSSAEAVVVVGGRRRR